MKVKAKEFYEFHSGGEGWPSLRTKAMKFATKQGANLISISDWCGLGGFGIIVYYWGE